MRLEGSCVFLHVGHYLRTVSGDVPQIQPAWHCLRSEAKWAHLRPQERHTDASDGCQRGRTNSRLRENLSYGSRAGRLRRWQVSQIGSRRSRLDPAHLLKMALEHPSARCRRGPGGAELNYEKCRAIALSATVPTARLVGTTRWQWRPSEPSLRSRSALAPSARVRVVGTSREAAPRALPGPK